MCDIINQTVLKFKFNYRVHVFDYIFLKSGSENLLACCTCQGERCNSQSIRSSNCCMPLNMFLLQNKNYDQIMQTLAAWRSEGCLEFGDVLTTTGLQNIVSPEVYISTLCVPARRRFMPNSVQRILRFHDGGLFARELGLSELSDRSINMYRCPDYTSKLLYNISLSRF